MGVLVCGLRELFITQNSQQLVKMLQKLVFTITVDDNNFIENVVIDFFTIFFRNNADNYFEQHFYNIIVHTFIP